MLTDLFNNVQKLIIRMLFNFWSQCGWESEKQCSTLSFFFLVLKRKPWPVYYYFATFKLMLCYSHFVASQEPAELFADLHLTAGYRKWKQNRKKRHILLFKKRYAISQMWWGKRLLCLWKIQTLQSSKHSIWLLSASVLKILFFIFCFHRLVLIVTVISQ